jgi:hypothetical protein
MTRIEIVTIKNTAIITDVIFLNNNYDFITKLPDEKISLIKYFTSYYEQQFRYR